MAALRSHRRAGRYRLVAPAWGAERPDEVDALQKAHVLERLAEATPPSGKGAPGFVLDPAWPKPLPHNWMVGDIGGIFVDRHDHISVYTVPVRSVPPIAECWAWQATTPKAIRSARWDSRGLPGSLRLLPASALGAGIRQNG